MKTKSWVWKHFKSIPDKNKVKCDHCDLEYLSGTSTSSLGKHLTKVHKLTATSSNALTSESADSEVILIEDNGEPSAKKPKLKDENSKIVELVAKNSHQPSIQNTMKPSLEYRIAKMAAVEGWSLNSIAKSEFVQDATIALGYKKKITSEPTIASKVEQFADSLRDDLKKLLGEKIEMDVRFSLTTDEWTSKSNSRYITVNLHEHKEHYNLGMIPATGSLKAERIKELIDARLKEYGIQLKTHIVAFTNDGASVMVKLGDIIENEQQICHSHGMHLAVGDCLYSKQKKSEINLSKNLDEAIFEAKLFVENGEFSEDHKSLLYYLSANIIPRVKDHLPMLSKYIAENKLSSESQIDYALDYLNKSERRKKEFKSDTFETHLENFEEIETDDISQDVKGESRFIDL